MKYDVDLCFRESFEYRARTHICGSWFDKGRVEGLIRCPLNSSVLDNEIFINEALLATRQKTRE